MLHCASVTSDRATLLRTMSELTVKLSKQKRKQAPTVNSSIFTYIVSNECMVIYMWREKNKNNLRLTKIDMEKRDGMQNKNPLGNHNFFCQKYKRKNCAIFICPYRETAVASNPCNFFLSKQKIKTRKNYRFPFLR